MDLDSQATRDITPWFADGNVLGPSPIHGNGLFSREPVARGGVILRFGGCFLLSSDRYSGRVLASTSIGLAECVILAEVLGSSKDQSDFLNHSCMPNLGFADAISLVAARDIDAGEELTIDYGYWEADEEWVLKGGCACGARECRTMVTGRDWRRSDLRGRFIRWASPFVRRRVAALHQGCGR